MPHHWFRVAPVGAGPRAQEATIRKIVRSHGGRVLYVGFDERDRCHVLLNMTKVKDPKKLRAALKAATGEKGFVLETPAERERRRRRK